VRRVVVGQDGARCLKRLGRIVDSQTLWDQLDALAQWLGPLGSRLHAYCATAALSLLYNGSRMEEMVVCWPGASAPRFAEVTSRTVG
jgi:hypothetical protein